MQQVDAGDLLGHRMLHLYPWVSFHKVERARLTLIEEKLEGANTAVVHRAGQLQGAVDDRLTQLGIEVGAGGDFQQLLVAPLQAAVTFPQMADRAAVAEHLHLDMPRLAYQLLDIQGAVAERRLRLRLAARIGRVQLGRLEDRTHATPAAAGQRLEHHRTMLGEKGLRLAEGHRTVDSANQRHAAAFGQRAGGGLVAEQFEHLRRRTDKGQAGSLAAPGELGILGEKAVAGMDRLATLGTGHVDQLLHVQVGRYATPAQRHGEIGLTRMQAGAVVFGEYRHRANAQVGAGAGDTNGDLAAVGNQHGLKGRTHSRLSSSFFFTLPVAVIGSAATTRISGTL